MRLRTGYLLMAGTFFLGGLIGQTISPHEIDTVTQTKTVYTPAPTETVVETEYAEVAPESCLDMIQSARSISASGSVIIEASTRFLDLISDARMAGTNSAELSATDEAMRHWQSRVISSSQRLAEADLLFDPLARKCEASDNTQP